MYSTNLIKSLQDKINSATTAEEVVYISEAIRKLNLGVVKTVATYTDLQSFFAKNGDVVFVEDEETLYFSVLGLGWERIVNTGSVSAWGFGQGTNGKLGTNNASNASSPVSVVGGFTNWIQVSGGVGHSLGIRNNGTAWAWGLNGIGQLGDGTITAKSSPVSVVGGFTDWVQLSAGGSHSLGLRSNGTIWSWGNNAAGHLGDNTTVSKSSPISVVGGFTDWIQISAGGFSHSIGLRNNGTIWGWGSNTSGRLGDGTTTNRSSPVSVVGNFTDWIQVSAGQSHTVALRSNGTAWSWGFNTNGRLGDNTVTASSSPVSVVGGFTDWIQVSAGETHTIGLRTNATAWAWGGNEFGSLGDGTIIDKSSPVSVVGGFTDWIQVSAGSTNSAALRADGRLWAWGINAQGQVGDGTTVSRLSPVSVVGGFTDWIQIDGSGSHKIGIRV